MVAYSFKTRFVTPILAGTKRQTIRADRKRHARPGEEIQLYTGMRTRHCKLIGRAECAAVRMIRLDFVQCAVLADGVVIAGGLDGSLDRFAQADGFKDWWCLDAFWEEEHPGHRIFDGVLIEWGSVR
jgi:hypothetical protein